MTLHGETLLRAGRWTPCRHWNRPSPWRRNWNRPAPCARALRYTQRYDEAADQLLHLVTKSPDKPLWQRSAIGALSQAGRPREAEALFERYVAQRACACRRPSGKPWTNWTAGSTARQFRKPAWTGPGRCAATQADRAQWERRARGHLVDHLLFDWLECREDSVEAMQLLGELDTGERFFAPLLRRAEAWWWPPPTSVPCTPA